MRKLLVASQNGGVGKTTTSVNLAAAAAKAGARVLLVDADPVGSVAHILQLSGHPERKTFHDLQTPLPGTLTCSVLPGLDVITPYDNSPCSDDELDDLLHAATSKSVEEQYDCMILNTPPFLGSKPDQLLSACDELVLVMRADPLATRTLPAFLELINRHSRSGKSIRMKGILLTLPESEEDGSRWERELRGRCGRRLFPESIPHDSLIEETEGTGEIAVLNHPNSPGGSSYLRVAAYLELPTCAGTHAETNRELSELLKDVIAAMPSRKEQQAATERAPNTKTPKDKPRSKPKSKPPVKVSRRVKNPPAKEGPTASRKTSNQTQEAPRPLRLRFEPMKKTARVRKGNTQAELYEQAHAPTHTEPVRAEPSVRRKSRRSPQTDSHSMSSMAIFVMVAVGMGFTIGLLRIASLSLPVILGILCTASILVGYLFVYNQQANAHRQQHRPQSSKHYPKDEGASNSPSQRRSNRNRPSRATRRPSIRP